MILIYLCFQIDTLSVADKRGNYQILAAFEKPPGEGLPYEEPQPPPSRKPREEPRPPRRPTTPPQREQKPVRPSPVITPPVSPPHSQKEEQNTPRIYTEENVVNYIHYTDYLFVSKSFSLSLQQQGTLVPFPDFNVERGRKYKIEKRT